MQRAKGNASEGATRQVSGRRHIGAVLNPATNVLQHNISHQLFWNSAPEGLFAIRVSRNKVFVFEDANPAFRSLTGIGDVKLAGRPLVDCLPDEMAQTLAKSCQLCIATGEPVDYDGNGDFAGTPRTWGINLIPIRDPVTDTVFMLTGRLRELKETPADEHNRQLLERIVDTSPDVIYVFDHAKGRNTFLSSRVREALGYSREFLQSLDVNEFPELIHPEDLPLVRQHMSRVHELADGATASVEYRCRTGDGVYRWFRSKESILTRANGGRVEKVVGILSDIDRLKKARIAFTDMNARLAAILASISDCYLTIDSDFRITDVNSAAAEWLGKERTDVVGRHYQELFPGAAVQAAVRRAISEGRKVDAELPSEGHSGQWIDLHVYPSGGCANIFFSDISKRKHAEEEAAQSRRLLNASIDALSAQIVILDAQGTIVASNKAWKRFAARQWRNRGAVGPGSNYLALYRKTGGRSERISAIVSGLSSLLAGRRTTIRHIYQFGGKGRWYRLIATRFVHESKVFAALAMEDVSDVREAKRALGELSDRIVTLQEDERQRIAIELHDSTAQHLAAIGLNAMSLRVRSSPDAETQALWGDVEDSLERAAGELRAFTYLLHTPNLDDDGLSAVLHRYVDGFAARTGLTATLKLSQGIDDLPILLRQSMLGIVQDALTSVHRRASASRFSIEQKFVGDRLHLFISDDGRAIKRPVKERLSTVAPVGVPGLRERLQRVDGIFEIKTGWRGTTLHVSVPLRAAQGNGVVA